MADNVIVKDYNLLFDPVVYLQTYYGDISTQDDVKLKLFRALHEAFFHGDLHGTRLLDIGSGPSICSVISAVPHFEEIYLSDYSDANRASLRRWLKGSGGHSFQTFFEYFLKLEGKDLHWSKREEELKSKVKDVLKCDLLQTQILPDGDIGQVDVITSSLCLEAAATDIGCYGDICKKIGTLLKEGGHVVLLGALQETFYVHDGHKFYVLYITKEEIIKSWLNAGFSVVNWTEERTPLDKEYQFSDGGAGFVLVARKVRK